ncbi:MAG: hypothetical protein A2561_04010 [Candidatus Staskawiczbacteria bacterium RIFOXYD1_FULL_32_13]|uniref:Uncharacterized protein n=1 Tax=Candidatus Staskawiczbacteria bacterium RIFOXYD1_FULL_32_13 TaxID=1802234 RepID=A0A1G2JKG9_9BACT|nr:MAG: hypothetical protein UR22_C0013G0011 [Parcubacteria group bacterium GW2011_GWC2_32_10]OGZ78213.1 MAG: hypothetical protein A2256_02860 [Candidatus Staskawiczbacteria bacterium RIFOXYA2_FULL_32_7]OGZ87604.1 MAG: hypothetical protein A2561_04010 [Candidatus Staskawiczbacteria bacterium RIFOXYD1_FULL_32_13]
MTVKTLREQLAEKEATIAGLERDNHLLRNTGAEYWQKVRDLEANLQKAKFWLLASNNSSDRRISQRKPRKERVMT